MTPLDDPLTETFFASNPTPPEGLSDKDKIAWIVEHLISETPSLVTSGKDADDVSYGSRVLADLALSRHKTLADATRMAVVYADVARCVNAWMESKGVALSHTWESWSTVVMLLPVKTERLTAIDHFGADGDWPAAHLAKLFVGDMDD